MVCTLDRTGDTGHSPAPASLVIVPRLTEVCWQFAADMCRL